ncbi:MAG: hypothetical protein Q9160_006744 [Pyrenula sp. 1 TL-2023]
MQQHLELDPSRRNKSTEQNQIAKTSKLDDAQSLPLTEAQPPGFTPTLPSYPQTYLLSLISSHDAPSLSSFLLNTLPQLQPQTQAIYSSFDALRSQVSAPALLLLAATHAEASEIFKMLWSALYAPHNPVQTGSPTDASSSSTPNRPDSVALQIPYSCLHHAALKGDISLARAFISCSPTALSRSPPPSLRGSNDGKSQILTALRHGHLDYLDFILSRDVELEHEWPRGRLVRAAVRMEWDDQEMEKRVRWLVGKGARVRGTGALRCVVKDLEGSVRVAEVLLENGADVEGFDENGEQEVDSLLMEAVGVGNGEMVKLLMK